jgi:hypothetical protein
MKHSAYSLLLAALALGTLAGCGKVDTEAAPETETALPVESIALLSETPEAEGGLTGLEFYENSRAVNENGDVFLVATLSREAMLGEKYLTAVQLYDLGDTNLLAVCSLGEEPASWEYEGDFDDGSPVEQLVVSYNTDTRQVESTAQLPTISTGADDLGYSYQEQVGNLLWSRCVDETSFTATAYDRDLNEVVAYANPEDADEYGYFSPDGSKYYFCQGGAILRYDTGSPEKGAQRLNLNMSFSVSVLSGLFTDSQGALYGRIYGMAGDLYHYNGVVNLDTGEIVYLCQESPYSLVIENDCLLAENYQYDDGTTEIIACNGDQPIRYLWQGENYLSETVLSSGDILFYYSEENEEEETSLLYLGLYDGDSGTMISSTHFSVDTSYAWPSALVVSQQKENQIYLEVGDRQGNTLFFAWEYGGTGHEMDGMTVSSYEVPETLIPDIDEQWDPDSLIPGECPEELLDLRAEADRLEEEFGINIYISQECCNYLGGYVVMAEDDHDTVEEALSQLEQQLSRYPDGFFRQFNDTWISGIDIYLAGTLMGRSEGVLDYAGGFQLQDGDRIVIVVDTSYPGALTSSLHHEISHAIETKLLDAYDTTLNENTWDGLNPEADCYAYSYQDGYDESLEPYIYGLGDPEDAYFIDDYSLTYPGEDRARLFEYVMCSDYYWIDLDTTPHLREKLDYYTQCIREGFDTTGWTEVAWENY